MATARRSGTNEVIETFGDGTRDYTSWSTWESSAAVQTDTTAAGSAETRVLEMYDDNSPYDQVVTFQDGTHDATYPVISRAATGHENKGTKNSGVRFESTQIDELIQILDPYVYIYDIGLNESYSSASSLHTVDIQEEGALLVGLHLYDSENTGSGTILVGIRVATSSNLNRIIDCGILNHDFTGAQNTSGTGTTFWYNVTIRDCAGFGMNLAQAGTAKNVLSDVSPNNDFNGSYTGSNNNASADATAPGTSSRINQTFTYAAAGDVHLGSADAGAQDFGADLSGDADFDFDDDIDLEAFSTWDIGCDEPGGGIAVPVFMHSYRRRRVM